MQLLPSAFLSSPYYFNGRENACIERQKINLIILAPNDALNYRMLSGSRWRPNESVNSLSRLQNYFSFEENSKVN